MTQARRFLTLIFGVIVGCQVSSVHGGDAVPVILWTPPAGANTVPINPLVKTSRAEFSQALNKNLYDFQPPILVFVKDNLCVEDLTQHKGDLQKVINDHLLAYFPAVESPLSVFEDLPFYNQTSNEDVEAILDKQWLIKPISDLDAIPEIYMAYTDFSPYLIAALTGRYCGYSRSERVKRATDPDDKAFIIRPKSTDLVKILLYSSEHPTLAIDKQSITLSNPSRTYVTNENNTILLHLEFPAAQGFNLEFKFTNSTNGYHTLVGVHYKKSPSDQFLTPNVDIVFPRDYSYHCTQDITFSHNSTVLTMKKLQVQIGAESFSDAYDCVGFTTIPIWSGIFVTTTLASIMIWALTMILDIHTMDRFDDPKGKTITISAQE